MTFEPKVSGGIGDLRIILKKDDWPEALLAESRNTTVNFISSMQHKCVGCRCRVWHSVAHRSNAEKQY